MNTRLNVLWIKLGGLWPINSGGRLRSFHIIRELSSQNDVTVLTTHTAAESEQEIRKNLPGCRVISFPLSPPKRNNKRFVFSLAASWLTAMPVDIYKYQCIALREQAESLLAKGQFDLCIADFLTAVPNTPMGVRTPVVLFSHNVEYMIWQRLHDNETSLLKRFLLSIETGKMRRYETQACNSAVATIAVSKEDVKLLQGNSPTARITSVPTGVDTEYFCPDPAALAFDNTLVFTGSMDWQPNEDAMLFFMRDILPLIRARQPSVKLSIVGRNPSDLLRREAAKADVEVTGTVADIRPWLKAACVYIVPIRIGGGTRLKIFEALATGMPVISTTIGAEGLDIRNGVHLELADTAADFAEQTLELLANPDRRHALGAAGRQLMEQHFSWPRIARHFEELCRTAIQTEHDDEFFTSTAPLKL